MEQAEPRDMPSPTAVPEPSEAPEPSVVAAPKAPAAKAAPRRRSTILASLAALTVVTVLVLLTGGLETLAAGLKRLFEANPVTPIVAPTAAETAEKVESGLYTLSDLDIHPDVLYQPYTAGPLLTGENMPSSRVEMIKQFRQLLALYEERQGKDDNFTIRVVDGRNNDVLEVFELEGERARFRQRPEGREWNWGRVDELRKVETRRLLQKYVAKGVPQDHVTIKWGRADQVREARERDAPYIEYELRLARQLGLSALSTEIGTVETFNSDRLVSTVGARSRYQMMPYVLRENDILQYDLASAAGTRIPVYEEWHPLLSMEGSFRTLAGYINAVGHEIPGISAYHTGPGNLFSIYRAWLTQQGNRLDTTATVMDAYMWAVTTGYPFISSTTSFKTYSRGYVATAYGSLRAMDQTPIDSTKTLRAERVQLAPGKEVLLTQLLAALGEHGKGLHWGRGTEEMTPYDRFRHLNPHIVLPGDSTAGVSPQANVRLVADVNGAPVRFFLPLGATQVLRQAGLDVLDAARTFRYDRNTYARPTTDLTMWDLQYQQLVENIRHFGFNPANRKQLFYLTDRFEELARANPTQFRRTQLEVIRTHKGIWQSGVYEKLASAVAAIRGGTRMETLPPSQLPGAPSAPRLENSR